MIITDAQVHLWAAHSPERPWPAPIKPRSPASFSAEEFLSVMDAAGVTRAVVVPPSYEGNRNDFGLAAASAYPERFALMGRIDLKDPNHPDLRHWRDEPGMLGVRLTFNPGPTAVWLTDGTADWFFAAAAEVGLPVMLYAATQNEAIGKIALKYPSLQLVIDHLNLNTRLRDDELFEPLESLYPLADIGNISVKVSSLPSYVTDGFPFLSLHPHIRRLLGAFGADRCMWGSDYTRLRSTYTEWVTAVTDHMDFLSSNEIELLMGGTLARVLDWPTT